MVARRDRSGEESYNSFGSKMIIEEYRKTTDIDVYFPEYNWVFRHATYSNFKKGSIKCPYEPRYYGKDYLLNFQHMGEWINKNYYEVPGETMCLDKDILCKGNKVYSRDTCIFVPERINNLFTKRDHARGDSPIGTTPNSLDNYQVFCHNGYGGRDYLGTYPTKEEAFRVYKENKEKVIKEDIDTYEGRNTEQHYNRLKTDMYKYEVKITD